MEPMIGMVVTGIHPVGIALLQAIGMVVQIVTLKMGMGKTKVTIEMVAQEGVVTGMEMEVQHVTRGEATGTTGQVLMTALAGEGAHLPLNDTRGLLVLCCHVPS